MGDVVHLNDHRPAPAINDGGKARIQARRELIGLAKQGDPIMRPDSLVMLRPDPELPCVVLNQATLPADRTRSFCAGASNSNSLLASDAAR